MTDFTVRSENVDVEQIMRQIRARIREKRGVGDTEADIRELANVKLEEFLDPRGVRSDLLDQFRRSRAAITDPPNFTFEDSTLYETHRGVIRWIRKLLNPVLKLFLNPNPLIRALHVQSELNTKREQLDALHDEVMHNLVLEITRLRVDVKDLRMRVESMSSRLDFDERRAKALEGVVMYRPGTAAPLQPPPGVSGPAPEGDQERRARRRRRRPRKRPGERPDTRQGRGEAGAGTPGGQGGPASSDRGPAERPAPDPAAGS